MKNLNLLKFDEKEFEKNHKIIHQEKDDFYFLHLFLF